MRWKPNKKKTQTLSLAQRLERFFTLSLFRFYLSLIDFIQMKVRKETLIGQLESMQKEMTRTSKELGILGKEISFLKENLKMIRSK